MALSTNDLILLIGGARSGKSRLALERARALAGELVYVATGEALDAEMAERIARHRAERGARWRTVEAPLDLPQAVARESGGAKVLVVDCLTLWLSNLMLRERDIAAATTDLLAALASRQNTVLLVSNEVGMGIVPENALARRFRDEAGRLNQAAATVADEVVLVCAGLSLRVKGGDAVPAAHAPETTGK
jgi:adenosylcobinamide kinase / adenosylcobinamide-phosphate guanylyltransferase